MVNPKKTEERRYISLLGDGKGEEVFPEAEFDDYDESDKAGVITELEKARKIDRLINECCFIALVVAAASAAVGLFVLLYRILKYPFIKKFAKDYDW